MFTSQVGVEDRLIHGNWRVRKAAVGKLVGSLAVVGLRARVIVGVVADGSYVSNSSAILISAPSRTASGAVAHRRIPQIHLEDPRALRSNLVRDVVRRERKLKEVTAETLGGFETWRANWADRGRLQ